jgi:hypothetical protein
MTFFSVAWQVTIAIIHFKEYHAQQVIKISINGSLLLFTAILMGIIHQNKKKMKISAKRSCCNSLNILILKKSVSCCLV